MKYIIYSDGGARGNPGPAAFGFLIKSEKSQIPNPKSKTPSSKAKPGSEAKLYYLAKLTTGQVNSKSKFSKSKTIIGSGYIGVATNNQAEYQGVIAALTKLYEIDNHPEDITIYLDSQLVVEQMNGAYKVKNPGLKPLFWQIRDMIAQLKVNIKFKHISREKNKEADKLVNLAIDKGK